MKFYIGIGGIGCRTLHAYSAQCKEQKDKSFFYIETDYSFNQAIENTYIIPGNEFGTGKLRSIGRNLIKYEILNGRIKNFFSQIQYTNEVELFFVVSSFGGFGGAAVSPLLEYLEAIAWNELKSCYIIAFNENAFRTLCFPEKDLQRFESNTIEFVNELTDREKSAALVSRFKEKLYRPWCTSVLIDTAGSSPDEFWKYLSLPISELLQKDCKSKYIIKSKEKRVFISFSSKDLAIAERIADALNAVGIKPWISTRDIHGGSYAKQIMSGIKQANVFLVLISKNSICSEHVKNEVDRAFSRIKEGLTVLPFLLDNSEYDDDLAYYLCRQEFISGVIPPIEDRIQNLVDRIRDIGKDDR